MINVYAEAEKLDYDSIGISLDVDGIKNVDEVLKVVKARLQTGGKKVRLWDVVVVMWLINRENRKDK